MTVHIIDDKWMTNELRPTEASLLCGTLRSDKMMDRYRSDNDRFGETVIKETHFISYFRAHVEKDSDCSYLLYLQSNFW